MSPETALFTLRPDEATSWVTIAFDAAPIRVPAGTSVAAALLAGGVRTFRTTPTSGSPRAPYCMMGACFECLVTIDGMPNRQSCLVEVREGMQVRTQSGPRALGPTEPEADS